MKQRFVLLNHTFFGSAVLLGLAAVVSSFDSLIALFIFLSNSLTADAGLLAESKSLPKTICKTVSN